MGNPLSSQLSDTEFQAQIKSLGATDLTPEHTDELNTFLKVSSDFTHFFTSCTLNDFRNLRKTKPMSLIYLMSHVSSFFNLSSQPFLISHVTLFTVLHRQSRSCMMQQFKCPPSKQAVKNIKLFKVL